MGAQSSGTALAQRHPLEYTFNSAYTNISERSEPLIQEKGVDFAEYGNRRLTFKCDFFFLWVLIVQGLGLGILSHPLGTH